MSFIHCFKNIPFTASLIGIATAATPPAAIAEGKSHPYLFGAQILLLGTTLAGAYIARKLIRHGDQLQGQIVPDVPHLLAIDRRTGAAAAPMINRTAAAAPSPAPIAPIVDEPLLAPSTRLYPSLTLGGELLDAQQESNPDSIELQSGGGQLEPCQLFLGLLHMNRLIVPDDGVFLENPITHLPMTTSDIATICDRFLIDARRFLDLWETASQFFREGSDEERDFRIDSAIELVRLNAPELADQLSAIRN